MEISGSTVQGNLQLQTIEFVINYEGKNIEEI